MTLKSLASLRLNSQQVAAHDFTHVKDVVEWMGAMQSQDYAMSKWGIGVRLAGVTEKMVNEAIDNADIIRTHVLRPTWHLVSAKDIYWMLELTVPNIHAAMKFNDKQLELTEAIFKKSNSILKKALASNNHLTRDEILLLLNKAKIITTENRASHLLVRAELEGIICSGPSKDKKQTYALLEERVPPVKSISRDTALEKLALRYFTSHGPATLQDFTWWSGLSIKDAAKALEMAKPSLNAVTVNATDYWFKDIPQIKQKSKAAVHLLPAFDEFIISYKDRAACIAPEHHTKAFTNNGIFKPVIVVDQQAAGIWKRTIKNNTALIEITFFITPKPSAKKLVEQAAKKLGAFLEKEVTIKMD